MKKLARRNLDCLAKDDDDADDDERVFGSTHRLMKTSGTVTKRRDALVRCIVVLLREANCSLDVVVVVVAYIFSLTFY